MKRAIPAVSVLVLGAILAGSSAQAEPASQASDLEAKGDTLRRQQAYDGAIKCYRQALRSGGDEAALYNKIGLADLRLQSYAAAQAAFEQAFKRSPSDANTLNNLGVASHLRQKYARAVKWYKQALALNESEPAFHYNLGASWFALGHFDRSSAEYARALELDPNAFANLEEQGIAGQPSGADRGRLYYLMAKLYAARGDLERALGLLRKAREQGYQGMDNAYRDREFAGLWKDGRLAQVVHPGRR